MFSKIVAIWCGLCALTLTPVMCEAGPARTKKASHGDKKYVKPTTGAKATATSSAGKKLDSSEAAVKRALAGVGGGGGTVGPGGAKNDPNHAVEIRGQSRTLSMMLVLKNGKENINFIKIRKDYNPEIAGTQY